MLYVLDTSAVIAFLEAEEGGDFVKNLLRDSGPKGKVSVSFVTSCELYYLLKPYEDNASKIIYNAFQQLPLQTVWANESLVELAGTLKGKHSISFAAAWVAATAQQIGAVLVHKDPEYEVVENLQQHVLPYK